MTISVSPNQIAIQTALVSFLNSILPVGVDVIAGQTNRVPEPSNPDYVVFWPINRVRISTNIDEFIDVSFVASVTAGLMNVTVMNYGTIEVGNNVFGASVPSNTSVSSLGTGTGGVGTYNLSNSFTVSSEQMAAGFNDILQPTEVVFQLDVHGPLSADNVQIISTLFRDTFATDAFAALNADVSPLYADDPRQVPFTNAEQQYETRWIIDLHLEANQSIIIPQQFAAALEVELINVEATYP